MYKLCINKKDMSNSPSSRASRASTFYIVQTDAAPLDVKDSWIVSQLKARENEFTETKTIRFQKFPRNF